MFYIDGVGYVSNDAGFTLANGSQKAAGWFRGKTPEQIAAIGAVPVTYGPKPDERYYWVTEHRNGAEITYTGQVRDDVLEVKLGELAARRWNVECAGIEVGGAVIQTDDRAKMLIHGKYTRAKEAPGLTFKWKAAGGFATIDSATIIAIGDAVEAHVQACFDKEAEHTEAMQALAAAEDWAGLIAYDFTTGWPATASAV